MPDAEIQRQEAMLDEIIDQVLVLDENPQRDDALIQRLQYDLAIKIHPPAEIARRYGFLDTEELRDYLTKHPQVIDGVKKIRALFECEEGIEARMRAKFQYATEELIPVIQHLVKDPGVPIASRVDSFKQLQRGAGMDGMRADKAETPAGQRFVLNILFSPEHRVALSGTVPEDPGSIPSLGSTSIVDEEPDEDVEV